MTDQWLKYEVFKQDRPGGPFHNVGSVHAPDGEMALMNARDVFARRPACVALWVVADSAIERRTADDLAGAQGGEEEAGDKIRYAVFSKQSQRQTMTYVDYVGEVAAHSPDEAMRLAAEAQSAAPGIVWWACPATAVVVSNPDDLPGLAAATGKPFRMPNYYHTVSTMQKIRRGEEKDE